MVELVPFVVLAKAVVLAVGAVVAHLAYRAFRRTGSPALRSLAAAFGAITLGGVLGSGIDRLLGLGLEVGVFVNATLTAVGFALVAHAVYVAEER